MKISSAYKVQYDLRPSKQTERRVLLDILRSAADVGFDLHKYKYLGFGGFKFYDFEMLFRHLGIRDMTSLEIDKSLFERCRFNLPFGFIDLRGELLADYLGRITFRKPLIAWLDYDCTISNGVIEDIRTLSAKAPVGSFVFVTVDARISDGMRDLSSSERLAEVRVEYQDYALVSSESELEPSVFPIFAEKIMWAALVDSMSKRSDGMFIPIIRVFYKDTAEMITIGGCLCPLESVNKLRSRLRRDFRFLVPSGDAEPFTIRSFNLSARERHLLDSTVTQRKNQKSGRKTLSRLGFTGAEIQDYKRMIRFLPKYFESYI
jgi:hypothetical protein